MLQFHNNYNLGFPAISGIEGGGNSILSSYGVGSFPTYILIAPNHQIVEQGMWPISSTESFINYFENNGLTQSPCGPPSCTQAITPLNLSSDNPVDVSLEWEPIADASGYRLYFGTDNPPTSIENGIDLGNSTTYNPVSNLNPNTDYYWQVVPYNLAGSAWSCQVFQFTTIEQTISLDLKLFLEGPYNSNQMIPHLNSFGFLPLMQPYNTTPWNYNGSESVTTIPIDAVDWVLVDILKPYDNGDEIKFELLERTSGFVMNDGSIKDLSGLNNISIPEISSDFHVRIQHRNHLPIVSSIPLNGFGQIFIYNFTSDGGKALGGIYAQNEVEPGIWAMIAADGNANLQVDNNDKNEVWLLQQGLTGYYNGDFNMDSDVNTDDKILSWQLNLGRGVYPVQDTVPGK